MISSSFRVKLPSSVKLLWEHPQRHVSQVIPNSVKLTMKIDHQKSTQGSGEIAQWLRYWLLFQRIQVKFLAPIWSFRIICNSTSRISHALFWPQLALCPVTTQICMRTKHPPMCSKTPPMCRQNTPPMCSQNTPMCAGNPSPHVQAKHPHKHT